MINRLSLARATTTWKLLLAASLVQTNPVLVLPWVTQLNVLVGGKHVVGMFVCMSSATSLSGLRLAVRLMAEQQRTLLACNDGDVSQEVLS